jgi:ankyrin repeat protein
MKLTHSKLYPVTVLFVLTFATLAMPGLAVASSEATMDLVSAIVSNDLPKARSAIARGADVNAGGQEGRTPLIAAAMFTRPEIVKLLLEHGADPGREADDATCGNALTAAFSAMNGVTITGQDDEPDPRKREAAVEVVRLIAAKKVGLNHLVRRATTSKTVLMIAAEAGVADVVQILLDAGADPNIMNGGKYTALDYAVDRAPVWSSGPRADRAKIVRALMAAGARKDRKGADGVLPVERARRAGYPDLVALLSEPK